MQYLDINRTQLKAQYPTADAFIGNFKVNQPMLDEFYAFAAKEGVTDTLSFDFNQMMTDFVAANKDSVNKLYTRPEQVLNAQKSEQFLLDFNAYVKKEMEKKSNPELIKETQKYINLQLRFLLARNLFDLSAGLRIWAEVDDAYNSALQVIQDEKKFKKMKISR